MIAKHTPGPWKWFGNRHGGVYLATVHGGRKHIMGFQRYGMNGAQPVFRCADRMVPAAEMVEFEVGDGTARGFKQADKDDSVYRYDVSGIDNADARLIAASPTMLEALEALEAALTRDLGAGYAGVALCQAAIAKAKGESSKADSQGER